MRLDEMKGVLDLQGSSYQSRHDFARWGMAIVKDHPVVGTGAGAGTPYHQYQDYLVYTMKPIITSSRYGWKQAL